MNLSSFSQQPRPATPNGERIPFRPAVKHTSFASPPPSPLSAPSSRMTRSAFSPQPEQASTFTPSNPSRPLTRSNVQNLPSFNLQTASPPVIQRKPSPPTSTLDSNSLPSAAPRIRARVTPAASPRRKPAVPGAENAEPAPSMMGPPSSPLKRSAPLSSFPKPPPLSPAPRSSPFTSPFHSLQSLPEDYAISERMASVSIGAPTTRDRGKGGKENVLVCVRVRPPAAKLAKSSAVIEELAWDVSELEGSLSLRAGGPEFLFGKSRFLFR
jgi:centromeric protein E